LRYLMVSTYPPTRCGIGAYAEQSVAKLRSEGHTVDVVSPDGQGDVKFAWDLRGGTRLLRLLRLFPDYDRVVLQYQWAFYYRDLFVRQNRWDTLKTTLSFMLLFLRKRSLEVVAHEIPFLAGKQGWVYKWKWKLAPRLIFHTSTELELFEKRYGMRLSRDRVEIRTHHAVFNRFSNDTRASARHRLGIDPNAVVFLCIGFLQRHKGFDRAIKAFKAAGRAGAELYVVGSIRVPHPDNTQYVSELRNLVSSSPATHLVESFVSNEDFDTWITAADWVVFPYAEIWSSGVLARTRLLDRPAIVSAVGGLPEQVGKCDLLFDTDEELVSAFHTAAEYARSSNAGKHGSAMLSEQER